MRVLVVDNYDSFTYNLVEYLGELGAEVHVVRNDRATVDELLARVFGANGFIDADYYTGVVMRGPEAAVRASVGDLYTSGVVVNINEFHDAVVKGDCSNPTVAPSARSNLTAILGREAPYRRDELTLAALLKEGKKLEPNLNGLKA